VGEGTRRGKSRGVTGGRLRQWKQVARDVIGVNGRGCHGGAKGTPGGMRRRSRAGSAGRTMGAGGLCGVFKCARSGRGGGD